MSEESAMATVTTKRDARNAEHLAVTQQLFVLFSRGEAQLFVRTQRRRKKKANPWCIRQPVFTTELLAHHSTDHITVTAKGEQAKGGKPQDNAGRLQRENYQQTFR